MGRYLLFAFSDCKDPAREEEFNDWYDNIHLPDMLEVPGMINATRWVSAESKEGQQRKYLAMYELETDDIEKFDLSIRERGMKTVKRLLRSPAGGITSKILPDQAIGPVFYTAVTGRCILKCRAFYFTSRGAIACAARRHFSSLYSPAHPPGRRPRRPCIHNRANRLVHHRRRN